eukprot:Nk52_evm11s240 gene=Nk52_evmTU11s240
MMTSSSVIFLSKDFLKVYLNHFPVNAKFYCQCIGKAVTYNAPVDIIRFLVQCSPVCVFASTKLVFNSKPRTRNKRSLLHFAKNAHVAKFLMSKHVQSDSRDSDGCTPLHTVTRVEVAEVLLNDLLCSMPDVTPLVNSNKETPLHTIRSPTVIRYLLECSKEDYRVERLVGHVNHKMEVSNALTPLFHHLKNLCTNEAYVDAANNHAECEIVSTLLEFGATVKVRDYCHNSTRLPVWVSILKNVPICTRNAIIRAVKCCRDVETFEKYSIFFAIHSGDIMLAKLMLSRKFPMAESIPVAYPQVTECEFYNVCKTAELYNLEVLNAIAECGGVLDFSCLNICCTEDIEQLIGHSSILINSTAEERGTILMAFIESCFRSKRFSCPSFQKGLNSFRIRRKQH